jgi:hypothetical protein
MRRTVLYALMLVVGLVRGSAGGFARVCVGGLARAGATALGRQSRPRVCTAPARALLCAGSIGRACDSGMFSAAQLEYMRASRKSCDARDVSWHRSVTKLVDAQGVWGTEDKQSTDTDRAANNEIMHALDARETKHEKRGKHGKHGKHGNRRKNWQRGCP